MLLKSLRLSNFRNYAEKEFAFFEKVTIVAGVNASGKTNLLEAVYLLSRGRSFRANLERECIRYGEQVARAAGLLGGDARLEVVLTVGSVLGKKSPYKKLLINGVAKRLVDFRGNFPTVLFWPEDLQLVTNSPSLRRRYLDNVLSQVDRQYHRALVSYEKALRVRNKLLQQTKENYASPTYVKERRDGEYWEEALLKEGEIISRKRAEFLQFLNNFQFQNFQFQIEYKKNEISTKRLREYEEKERLAGMTLVGPHRDDFVIAQIRNSQFAIRNLSQYGSRGEQRLGVLWLKLGELEFVAEKAGARPVFLLDDIFSELDEDHRRLVMQIIPKQQTIVTTTGLHFLDREFLKKAKIIKTDREDLQ